MSSNSNEVILWSPGIKLEEMERRIILTAFRHYRGNKTTTAAALGISVRTIENKLAEYQESETKARDVAYDERKRREEFLARSRGPARDATGQRAILGTDGSLDVGPGSGNVATNPSPRGQSQDAQDPSGETGVRPSAGPRVEPAQGSTAKPTVPMSERKEVQGVLPSKSSASGSGSRR